MQRMYCDVAVFARHKIPPLRENFKAESNGTSWLDRLQGKSVKIANIFDDSFFLCIIILWFCGYGDGQ